MNSVAALPFSDGFPLRLWECSPLYYRNTTMWEHRGNVQRLFVPTGLKLSYPLTCSSDDLWFLYLYIYLCLCASHTCSSKLPFLPAQAMIPSMISSSAILKLTTLPLVGRKLWASSWPGPCPLLTSTCKHQLFFLIPCSYIPAHHLQSVFSCYDSVTAEGQTR